MKPVAVVARGGLFGTRLILLFIHASGKYPFTYLLVYFSKKIEGFLCFTPPENAFWESTFFSIVGSLSTFQLFHSYESKKVSGRFPDVLQKREFHSVKSYVGMQ